VSALLVAHPYDGPPFKKRERYQRSIFLLPNNYVLQYSIAIQIKSRAQQITLKPNIIKVKNLLANVLLFTVQHLQSNLNEFTGYGIYIYKIMV
jgi:hypothetical protein